MATPEKIYEAREERNRAWTDRMGGRISEAELFSILRRVREQFGQAIYARRMAPDDE